MRGQEKKKEKEIREMEIKKLRGIMITRIKEGK